MSQTVQKSRVYTDRPAYADFDAPKKFQTIQSIIAERLVQHPTAICSYSGGSDSDIMLHLIESTRRSTTASSTPAWRWRPSSGTRGTWRRNTA